MVLETGRRIVIDRLPPRCADVSVGAAVAELARLERRWAMLSSPCDEVIPAM